MSTDMLLEVFLTRITASVVLLLFFVVFVVFFVCACFCVCVCFLCVFLFKILIMSVIVFSTSKSFPKIVIMDITS